MHPSFARLLKLTEPYCIPEGNSLSFIGCCGNSTLFAAIGREVTVGDAKISAESLGAAAAVECNDGTSVEILDGCFSERD